MNVLFDAIMTKYAADGTLSGAMTGGLSLLRAKQKPSYPYAVFFPAVQQPKDTFTEDIENFLIQFNIYDDPTEHSPTDIDTVKGYLWACFDDCLLTVSGYDHIFMQRRNTHFLDMGDSYQYSVEYEVMIEKQ